MLLRNLWPQYILSIGMVYTNPSPVHGVTQTNYLSRLKILNEYRYWWRVRIQSSDKRDGTFFTKICWSNSRILHILARFKLRPYASTVTTLSLLRPKLFRFSLFKLLIKLYWPDRERERERESKKRLYGCVWERVREREREQFDSEDEKIWQGLTTKWLLRILSSLKWANFLPTLTKNIFRNFFLALANLFCAGVNGCLSVLPVASRCLSVPTDVRWPLLPFWYPLYLQMG